MTFANSLRLWFGITNNEIWGISDQIKSLLPKFRSLNSIVVSNTYIESKINVLTDTSFRPNTYNPNRAWHVYQGINFPVINPMVFPWPGPNGYDWHSAVKNNTLGFRYPFSVKKGLLKREYLALDAYFSYMEYTFQQKSINALSIVEKVTNLSTYYPDNDDTDYANTIAYHQSRADHLAICLATLSLLRSQIATNIEDINNFAENDFPSDVPYGTLIAALTYPTELLDYISNYNTSSINTPSEYIASLLETFASNQDFPYNDEYYNPIRTEGSIERPHDSITEFFSTKVNYKSLGILYDEEFVDPTLHPKGTPVNEDTVSLRKSTNALILGTINTRDITKYYDHVAWRPKQIGQYLSDYVDLENLDEHSNTFRFGSRPNFSIMRDRNEEYLKGHVDVGLILNTTFSPGTTDPVLDQGIQKSSPKVISSEFNYKVRPKILLLARYPRSDFTDTVLVGVNMLLRKTVEADFIANDYYTDTGGSTTDWWSEGRPEGPYEDSNDPYWIMDNHLSPKETLHYIEKAEEDYPFAKIVNGPTNSLSYTSSKGTKSTLISDNTTENYGTSYNINHIDPPEKNHKQIVNIIDEYGNLSLSHTNTINSTTDNYTKTNGRGIYVHSHGREHPSLGLYDLEDLFISASHLGDRCESEDDPPKIVYRRAYAFEDTSDDSPKGTNTSYSYSYTSFAGTADVEVIRSELVTVTKEYVATEDIIWFGRGVDAPVPLPHIWVYKIQTHTFKQETINFTSFSPFYSDYISTAIDESRTNVYLWWAGYEIGYFNEKTYTDPLVLRILNTDTIPDLNTIDRQTEWLKAKHYFKIDYYDDDGNLTSTDVRTNQDNTFTETSIDNIVNFLKNQVPPYPQLIPEELGQGFNYVPTFLDNFVFGFPNNPYSLTQDRTCRQIKVIGVTTNGREEPFFNVNFEIDSPL